MQVGQEVMWESMPDFLGIRRVHRGVVVNTMDGTPFVGVRVADSSNEFDLPRSVLRPVNGVWFWNGGKRTGSWRFLKSVPVGEWVVRRGNRDFPPLPDAPNDEEFRRVGLILW